MTRAALPRPIQPFVALAELLRANGFAVAPEQTTAFLSAITLLGPRSLDHIRRAAHATLAPPPERREEFDALFDAHFLGAVELGREIASPILTTCACRRTAAAASSRRPGRHQQGRPSRNGGRGLVRPQLRARRRDRHAPPLPARGARASAAAARLPAHRGQARPRARPAPRHEGGDPQRRRDLPPASPAPPAPPRHPAAHRRVGLHEGAHRRPPALCPCSGARGRPHRGVHHRHAADARDAALQLKNREQALAPRPASSPTGTAARASAMPCRPSSPCRALPALRAAPWC